MVLWSLWMLYASVMRWYTCNSFECDKILLHTLRWRCSVAFHYIHNTSNCMHLAKYNILKWKMKTKMNTQAIIRRCNRCVIAFYVAFLKINTFELEPSSVAQFMIICENCEMYALRKWVSENLWRVIWLSKWSLEENKKKKTLVYLRIEVDSLPKFNLEMMVTFSQCFVPTKIRRYMKTKNGFRFLFFAFLSYKSKSKTFDNRFTKRASLALHLTIHIFLLPEKLTRLTV